MVTAEYRVSGMSCSHCEAAVHGEVTKIDGVEDIDVSAGTGRLVITSSAPIDTEAVLGAVDEAGYEAVPVA
ncbi:heavy-metal-associated domain-containing protein [Mycobacterium parmense]|uniref:Copper chaperone n=1 Tax=Mycobacterium parmense TaxID=185642 RepID=A0A7I7YXC0_9MYCO|nr:heavy metal-associated domain-containing protein [Mycobacterium parmense]MCV7349960.1 heavy-metal-associated domain-containing protein [Mycobacterium parmense]ORW59390.1 heavy metal transporter [Mycobacterium parmense]BBZ46508.1 copper chaperone [Mycobacterium parmense]